MTKGFYRPQGQRSIEVVSNLGILVPTVWELFNDKAKLARAWGEGLEISTIEGCEGQIWGLEPSFSASWHIETQESRQYESLKAIFEGNPWHHRPDLFELAVQFEFGEICKLKLSGFDLTHIGDAPLLSASSWAYTKMAMLTKFFGKEPEKCVSGTRSIEASTIIKATPDTLRSMLLRADEAVKWLADMVQIEARESGQFQIAWQRPWGNILLHGVVSEFESDRITLVAKDNPFSPASPLSLRFSFFQEGENTKLSVVFDGFDVQPWASFSVLLFSEIAQVSLAGLGLIVSEQ